MDTSVMDKLGELIQNFDPDNFMPELDTLLGKVELIARIAVLAGPVILLALGLLYFLVPPKEANHSFGYRFFWGMASVESWLFTQKLAGIAWAVMGFVMVLVMGLICNGYHGMEAIDIVWSAAKCLLWQMGFVAASIVLIDLTVVICYDRKGIFRFSKKKKRTPRKKK